MNSNGIPEMIRAAGKSEYQTPQYPWWAALLIGLALGFLLGVTLCVSSARASPSCMTYTEARQVWPTKYLHWRGEHCWSYGHQERQHVERVPIPKERPFVPVWDSICNDTFECRWWMS